MRLKRVNIIGLIILFILWGSIIYSLGTSEALKLTIWQKIIMLPVILLILYLVVVYSYYILRLGIELIRLIGVGIHKIGEYLNRLEGKINKGEYTTDFVCPKCQKGNLLIIPNKDGVFICDTCYLMVEKYKLNKAIETDYVDNKAEEEKYFDEVIENQNKRNFLYRDMIKRGKRIVKTIKEEEKRIRNKKRDWS